MKGFLITAGVFIVLGLSILFWAIGVSNDEIKLRNRGKAQQENCAAFFDKMWKVLQQDAQVADQYKEAFKEIYVPLIEGRYSQGDGTLMKWITEHNPQFDVKLYDKLMTAIEGQREGFFMEQQKLIDINRQHKDMRMTIPKKWVIGTREDLAIVIIKSLKTEDAYKTGQENDIDLFPKKNN
jgi:hypothetical protein